MAIGEDVVGRGAVIQSVFEVDAAPILKVPVHVRELGVDLHPQEAFTPCHDRLKGSSPTARVQH